MKAVLGIDLGTTNSAMAYVNDYGRPEIVENSEGGRITPSVVLFDGREAFVGTIAENMLPQRPLDGVREVKRHMGEPDWRHLSAEGTGRTAEEVSAVILRKLAGDAGSKLSTEITKAVITVPAYFDDPKRQATMDAGSMAGLDVVGIINEPTAAALAYGLDRGQDGTILIYDLGGGTFDVTVMRINGSHLEVLFSGGDSRLGGADWDNVLMELTNSRSVEKGGMDQLANPSTLEALRAQVRTGKHALSSGDGTKIFVGTTTVPVTRAEFEDSTAHLLDRTIFKTEEVLDSAKVSWRHIDKVLLVGGSTRMPAVARRLGQLWGRKPSLELNPDEVVAVGAALHGALTVGGESTRIVTSSGQPLSRPIVEDVTSHSLGVEIVEEGRANSVKNAIVLKAGSKVPCQASEVFYTLHDRQAAYECVVYQGEEEDIAWVTEIGRGTIRLPGSYPRGAPMEVAFEYDSNSIIRVLVTDRVTNMPLGELKIDRRANLSEQELARAAADLELLEVN